MPPGAEPYKVSPPQRPRSCKHPLYRRFAIRSNRKASGACVSPRHGIDSALIDRRRGQAVEMIARKWDTADWDDPVLDRESHAWAPAFPFSRYQRTASSVQRTTYILVCRARSTKAQIVCLFWGITVNRAFASAASIRIVGAFPGWRAIAHGHPSYRASPSRKEFQVKTLRGGKQLAGARVGDKKIKLYMSTVWVSQWVRGGGG